MKAGRLQLVQPPEWALAFTALLCTDQVAGVPARTLPHLVSVVSGCPPLPSHLAGHSGAGDPTARCAEPALFLALQVSSTEDCDTGRNFADSSGESQRV